MPIILITAYGSKALLVDCLHQGCNGYIEKPFNPEDLVKKIENVLEKKSKDNHIQVSDQTKV